MTKNYTKNLMKVSKKDETLARAILEATLINSGFPRSLVEQRVNEAWPGCLNQAKLVNLCHGCIKLKPLDGCVTDEQIEKWE